MKNLLYFIYEVRFHPPQARQNCVCLVPPNTAITRHPTLHTLKPQTQRLVQVYVHEHFLFKLTHTRSYTIRLEKKVCHSIIQN